MRFKAISISLCLVSSISACGGSSTSGGPSFETLSTSGSALLEQYGNAAPTGVDNMPITGTATYRGVAAYSSDSSDPVYIAQYADTLSELELNANFGTSTISGRAYNFKTNVPGVSIDGQVNVNGTISGNTFDADLSGSTVESNEAITANLNYTGTAQGEFVGTDAQAVRGTGTATGDAGILGSYTVYMLWGAER